MSYPVFENTLARLLTDEKFLVNFIKDPHTAIQGLDLIADERIALLAIDKEELRMTARSFFKKRADHHKQKNTPLWKRIFTFRSNQ